MRRSLAVLSLAVLAHTGSAEADPDDMTCDGRILHDGLSIQACYPRTGVGDWSLEASWTRPRGFTEMSFALERSVCLRRRRGRCVRFRTDRAHVTIVGRRGMSLREAAKTLARLNGLRRVRRVGREYRISGGRRRDRRVMILTRHPEHDRFLILLVARHGRGAEFAGARVFAKRIGIDITRPQ